MLFRVLLRKPDKSDRAEFLSIFKKRKIIPRFVHPPSTKNEFLRYVIDIVKSSTKVGFLVCLKKSGKIIGVINITEIVKGKFQSAYLGFYLSKEFEGNGYMAEGLMLAIRYAFKNLKLHRLEANIQPNNIRSINLVKRLGFKKEGFSPRYLKIGNRWRDHERWTVLKEKVNF